MSRRTEKKFNELGQLHSDEGPAIIEYDDNENVTKVMYYQNGKLHNSEGFESIIEYDENGQEIYFAYHKNGQLHNLFGPAEVSYFERDFTNICENCEESEDEEETEENEDFSRLMRVIYAKNGQYHNEDGPAIVEYDYIGNIILEAFYLNGLLYSNDMDVSLSQSVHGEVILEERYKKGKLHSPGIVYPSRIEYKNNRIILQEFHKNGKLHNLFGPARILYHENGKIREKVWFINGRYKNGEHVIRYDEKGNIIERLETVDGLVKLR